MRFKEAATSDAGYMSSEAERVQEGPTRRIHCVWPCGNPDAAERFLPMTLFGFVSVGYGGLAGVVPGTDYN